MQPRHQAFFYSLFLSRLADQILLFLVPLVVFRLTGSVAWSGAAFFFESLLRFLAYPLCGILSDRIPPLALLRFSQLCRAAASFGGIVGYAAFGGIGWLIAISAISGVLTTQGMMAREVMLPQVFNGRRFEEITSYTQIADQVGMVLGPLVAAGLLEFCSWEYVILSATLLFLAADGTMTVWQRIARPILITPEITPCHWTLPLATALRHIARLPGLLESVLLAAAVNLVIGVTLATSAAMVTGIHGETSAYYAALQTAAALATVIILFAIAHTAFSLRTLGATAYAAIFAGGLMTGLALTPNVYALGFILIIGFDKMFNIFIRTLRLRIIPKEDLGKTVGLTVMLNNLTQPLAGLLVSALSGIYGPGRIIAAMSCFMAVNGVLAGAIWVKRAVRRTALDQA